MKIVLWLLAIQGVAGAFDTLYYHEFRERLPARPTHAARELKLHAARDFLYAILFAALPRVQTHGAWAILLIAILIAEIVITMTDFAIEAVDRKPFGDVDPGERITHALMGICYGAMLAFFVPTLWSWIARPPALVAGEASLLITALLTVMSVGVFASGIRDICAALRLPGAGWPWVASDERERIA